PVLSEHPPAGACSSGKMICVNRDTSDTGETALLPELADRFIITPKRIIARKRGTACLLRRIIKQNRWRGKVGTVVGIYQAGTSCCGCSFVLDQKSAAENGAD